MKIYSDIWITYHRDVLGCLIQFVHMEQGCKLLQRGYRQQNLILPNKHAQQMKAKICPVSHVDKTYAIFIHTLIEH